MPQPVINLLFEYGLKCLFVAGLCELVLYRLVSRLGMHLSQLSEKYEFVKMAFRTLSSLGVVLLNLTAMLLFFMVWIILIQKVRHTRVMGSIDRILIPSVALLVGLTVAYLVIPPTMGGSILYNGISVLVLAILAVEFMTTHHVWRQRIAIGTFLMGMCGWLSYHTLSTSYGLLGIVTAPPLVNEIHRAGEALMVLASLLVLWAYGSTPFFTKNATQQRRGLILLFGSGTIFVLVFFLDFFLSSYAPSVAEAVQKTSQGIGWIFQMGMGYTLYLPFPFYLAGFMCWSYTVIKLVVIGRLAGYGLGLMFMAGYALQLSHLTMMVVVGLMLMNLDKRGTFGKLRSRVTGHAGKLPQLGEGLGLERK